MSLYNITDLNPPPDINFMEMPELPYWMEPIYKVAPPPLSVSQRLNMWLVNNRKVVYAFAGTMVLLAILGKRR